MSDAIPLCGCEGEPHACDQEMIAALEGSVDRMAAAIARLVAEVSVLRTELARAYPIEQAAIAFLDEAPDLVDTVDSVRDLARVVDRTVLYTDDARIAMLPARLRGA